MGAALLAFVLSTANTSAFLQLRRVSEYEQDRINPEKTYFTLRDTGAADFGWASEWTMYTSIDHEEKSAILLWQFKDGSKGYTTLLKEIGEAGKTLQYMISGKASGVEDVYRKPILPLTLKNYPVKVEIWIGRIESTEYFPEILVDAACFNAPTIELNRTYYFSGCKSDAERQ
jgi:hypothetical protein